MVEEKVEVSPNGRPVRRASKKVDYKLFIEGGRDDQEEKTKKGEKADNSDGDDEELEEWVKAVMENQNNKLLVLIYRCRVFSCKTITLNCKHCISIKKQKKYWFKRMEFCHGQLEQQNLICVMNFYCTSTTGVIANIVIKYNFL